MENFFNGSQERVPSSSQCPATTEPEALCFMRNCQYGMAVPAAGSYTVVEQVHILEDIAQRLDHGVAFAYFKSMLGQWMCQIALGIFAWIMPCLIVSI